MTVRVAAGAAPGAGPSLQQIRLALRRGELRASELLAQLLARIDRIDAGLRAFVHVDTNGAARRAGTTVAGVPGDSIRPLAGVPFACKDTIDVLGMPTGYGTRAASAGHPTASARVVEVLTAAGANCIGKLATTEFAAGDYREPAPRNPWRPNHTPGGSSGGAAAAVAAGLVPFAVAADTGGSARVPASFCGVSAFRPARGVLSLRGLAPLSPSFDQLAWIAPDPGDLALLWGVMTGTAARTAPQGGGTCFRVAVVDPWARLDDDVTAAYRHLVAKLPGAGITTTQVGLPRAHKATAAAWVVTYTEAARIYGSFVSRYRAELTPALVRKIEGARCFDARDVERARDVGRRFRLEVQAALSTADALLMPATPMTAPSTHHSSHMSDVAAFTRPIAFTATASLSAPISMGSAGLPVGAQLVGGDTRRLLGLAVFLQQQGLLGQAALGNAVPPSVTAAVPALSPARAPEAAAIGPGAARDEARKVLEDLWADS